jgi:hypothetical protein
MTEMPPETNESALVLNILKSNPISEKHLPQSEAIRLMPFIKFDNGASLSKKIRGWFRDPEVMKYQHSNSPYTDNPNRRVTEGEFLEYFAKHPNFAYFVIYPTAGSGPIGIACYQVIDWKEMSFNRAILIGDTSEWNKGIGGRVGKMMMDKAKELGFKVAKSWTFEENVASAKNLKKHFGLPVSINGNELEFEQKLN